jgi:hypothetical protein
MISKKTIATVLLLNLQETPFLKAVALINKKRIYLLF